MGKKDEKVEAVLELLKKPFPPSVKQVLKLYSELLKVPSGIDFENFCTHSCVERFLKAKGGSVKKAAKSLRACLSWRDSIDIEHLIADEFPVELAEGMAYVAGHDDESRPVLVLRMKQDYLKFHTQKRFISLLVFTLEVAIGTMKDDVEQFVLLFDAILFRSASACMNTMLSTLKIVADFYPGQLYRAFIIDPPSVFPYVWKGMRPFVELSTLTMVICSFDFEESLEFKKLSFHPRATSLRFEHQSIQSPSQIGSSSSRFSVIVHSDSLLKPWSLTLTSTPPSEIAGFPGPANTSHYSSSRPVKRSLNFASSTPLTPKAGSSYDASNDSYARTPRPEFFQSPALIFRKECNVNKIEEKPRGPFLPFLKFYRRPYDEMIYRSMMRPPLSGLISIVRPHRKGRNMASVSQRF